MKESWCGKTNVRHDREEQREIEKQEMSKKKVMEDIERIIDFEIELSSMVQVPLILIVILSLPQKKEH